MATLVFSAIGTLVGGPLGGSIGALIGRQVDGAIFGGGRREGPRLRELSTTTSSYGAPVPRLFGRMRVPGTIIWSTDLVEHREKQGSGKGRPSINSYSYTVSFAVALSSRPIDGIGRVWADGNLMRGAAGDLKVGGSMRIHTGAFDQAADPLMASAEGPNRCPAYRGLAYVVFEDLDLSDFFNRIPTLTFEVFADQGSFTLQQIVGTVLDEVDADVSLADLKGLSVDGPLVDTLQLLDPLFPIACDAGGDRLVFARERLQAAPIILDEAAVSVRDEDFGGALGYARKRAPVVQRPPEVLRYYDVDRDYLPGLQRALGRAGPGQPQTIELPAAMTADAARALVERLSRTSDWSREKMMWRTAELDRNVAPGAIVAFPAEAGRWRVDQWEWRDTGVELSLSRIVPTGADSLVAVAVDPGRVSAQPDAVAPASLLAVFELPWDGAGSGDTATVVAAVSSAGATWKGAALFVDRGDGNLISLGPSGRTRSIVGVTASVLPPANPLLFDRSSTVLVRLPDATMTLENADARQLAEGANRALIGEEILQFASPVPLGGGLWQLTGLLRARGGTEAAIASHVLGETFALLDGTPVMLDAALLSGSGVTVLADGLGDPAPITSGVGLRGLTLRPYSPVHRRAIWQQDGSLELSWTRRTRGAGRWDDGVDAPLHEQAESYVITYGSVDSPAASWFVATPRLALDAITLTQLRTMLPGGALSVRQQGSYALSDPLILTSLP